MPSWVIWVILGVFFVLMIVLTIVPSKKRQKQQQAMMSSLTVGSTVMTIGRLLGKVVSINNADNTVIINVGTEEDPTFITIDRDGIGYVKSSAAPTAPQSADSVIATSEPAEEAAADESSVADAPIEDKPEESNKDAE